MLGTDGVTIPPRNTSYDNRILLLGRNMEKFFDHENHFWKWFVRFYPKTSDAMVDTDYIYIQSRIHIEGTNSFDSLFAW
jgi:hypothetical protein